MKEEAGMLNIGATCETCLHRDGSNRRACLRCERSRDREYRPGWEPAPGVKYALVTVSRPSGAKGWKRETMRQVLVN